MPHNWTQEENQYILDNYKTKSKKEFCTIFDVSMASINHKYQRLGIIEKSIMGQSYNWSDSDIEYLKENWLYKTDEDIWKELNIGKCGFGKYVVTRKRIQLGLVDKSHRIRTNKDGYKYWIDYDKPIFTHREKMEEQLGRSLDSAEIVHHIDGNKGNDDIKNLYLCKNNAEHQKLHNQIEQIAFILFRQGIIKFDEENGSYYL